MLRRRGCRATQPSRPPDGSPALLERPFDAWALFSGTMGRGKLRVPTIYPVRRDGSIGLLFDSPFRGCSHWRSSLAARDPTKGPSLTRIARTQNNAGVHCHGEARAKDQESQSWKAACQQQGAQAETSSREDVVGARSIGRLTLARKKRVLSASRHARETRFHRPLVSRFIVEE